VLVLGVPIFDAVAVVWLRLRRGAPIYVGDNTHLSHRLTDMGLTRPQAVFIVCLLAFAIGAGAVALLWLPLAGTVIVLLQTGAILSVISLLEFFVKDSRKPSC
jgi:UDP-GlcNAc:undecaprenyl-phosphate GlcNAc-1-phosphate transferase